MVVLDVPESINGDALVAELRAAGIDVADVMVVGDRLRVVTSASEDDVAPVVAAHTGKPLPDPQEQARSRFRDAVSNATSIADLKAALLGTDTDAEPDVRPGRPA